MVCSKLHAHQAVYTFLSLYLCLFSCDLRSLEALVTTEKLNDLTKAYRQFACVKKWGCSKSAIGADDTVLL